MNSEFMHRRFFKIVMKPVFFTGLSLVLFSCGGGGGGGTAPPAEKTGVFLDAVVSGALFETSSGGSGTTNTSGEFQYLPGDKIVFSIGEIQLPPVPGADFVTPLQMGATNNINEQRIINILRFLQSLDSDGNANNEITLPAPDAFFNASGQVMNFSLNEADFEAALTAFLNTLPGNLTPVSAEDAKAHFESSLFQQMAGIYNGTFSGDLTGKLRLTLDASGEITGTATQDRLGQQDAEVHQLSGSVQSNGAAALDVFESSGNFTGTVTLSGKISGTWSNLTSSTSGTFSGEKEVLADGFIAAILPGTYDFVVDGTGVTHVYTFNAASNSFVAFGDGRGNRGFNWVLDDQGRLIMTFISQEGLPDRMTLISGTASGGRVSLDADDDNDGVYEVFTTGTFTKN